MSYREDIQLALRKDAAARLDGMLAGRNDIAAILAQCTESGKNGSRLLTWWGCGDWGASKESLLILRFIEKESALNKGKDIRYARVGEEPGDYECKGGWRRNPFGIGA